MSSGKRDIDMEEIKVEPNRPDYVQYHDRKQELREALESVSDNETDGDEADEFVIDLPARRRKCRRHGHSESDSVSSDQAKPQHDRERKGPRLALDEALILVYLCFIFYVACEFPNAS